MNSYKSRAVGVTSPAEKPYKNHRPCLISDLGSQQQGPVHRPRCIHTRFIRFRRKSANPVRLHDLRLFAPRGTEDRRGRQAPPARSAQEMDPPFMNSDEDSASESDVCAPRHPSGADERADEPEVGQDEAMPLQQPGAAAAAQGGGGGQVEEQELGANGEVAAAAAAPPATLFEPFPRVPHGMDPEDPSLKPLWIRCDGCKKWRLLAEGHNAGRFKNVLFQCSSGASCEEPCDSCLGFDCVCSEGTQGYKMPAPGFTVRQPAQQQQLLLLLLHA